jgi:hypothetical protein
MPTGTIEFKCIRINLKSISTFKPDEGQIDSLIEFDLKIGDERLRDLSAEVRQRNRTDFQSQPLEVGNVIGYTGPWNYEEFRELCGQYYRDVIGSSGVGRTIKRRDQFTICRNEDGHESWTAKTEPLKNSQLTAGNILLSRGQDAKEIVPGIPANQDRLSNSYRDHVCHVALNKC